MITKYFFATQLSLNSIINIIHHTYFYCTYMLYDAYFTLLHCLDGKEADYFIYRKELPYHSFSFLIFPNLGYEVKLPYERSSPRFGTIWLVTCAMVIIAYPNL